MTKLCLVPAFGLLLCLLGCIENSAETMPTQMPTTHVQQTPSPNGEGNVALATARSNLQPPTKAPVPPTAIASPLSELAVTSVSMPTQSEPNWPSEPSVHGSNYPPYAGDMLRWWEDESSLTVGQFTIQKQDEQRFMIQMDGRVVQSFDIGRMDTNEDGREDYFSGELRSVVLHDFEQDDELELVAEVVTLGTTCCHHYLLFTWDSVAREFVFQEDMGRYWASRAVYVDLDQNGSLQFFTGQYALFLGDGAFFNTPLILTLAEGQLIDVTDQYPEISEQSANYWTVFLEANPQACGIGAWSAYFMALRRVVQDTSAAWNWYVVRCGQDGAVFDSREGYMALYLDGRPYSQYDKTQPQLIPTPTAELSSLVTPSADEPVAGEWTAYRPHKVKVTVVAPDGSQQTLNICELELTFHPDDERCEFEFADGVEFYFNNFDSDSHVDLIVNSWQTYGTNPVLMLVAYDVASEQFVPTAMLESTQFLHTVDLDSNGVMEFVRGDEAFDEAFGADWDLSPIQVYGVRDGELVLISAEFPTLIKESAQRSLVAALEHHHGVCHPYAWGDYLADMYTLGQGQEARDLFESTCQDHTLFERRSKLIYDALDAHGYTEP
ncbi:MAG: hypothetical protein ACPG8W_22990 [Candidatus Promineifilaceae bacterium]